MPCVRAHCHSDFRSTVASHQTFVKPQTPTSWLRLSAEHCKGCAKFLKAWEMAFKMYSCVPSASPVYSYYLKDLDQIINIRKHSIFFFKSLLTTLRTECPGMLPIPFENYQREAQSGFFFFFFCFWFFFFFVCLKISWHIYWWEKTCKSCWYGSKADSKIANNMDFIFVKIYM